VSSARHLERGAPGEGQQQQTVGVGAIQDQMRDPMGEGLGLTGARTGRDQQRRRRLCVVADAVFDSAALPRGSGRADAGGHRLIPASCSSRS
jgi:hypothetical protein